MALSLKFYKHNTYGDQNLGFARTKCCFCKQTTLVTFSNPLLCSKCAAPQNRFLPFLEKSASFRYKYHKQEKSHYVEHGNKV